MAAPNPHRTALRADANKNQRVPLHRPGFWQQCVPGPQGQGLVSGVLLVSGFWLAAGPFLWTYDAPVGGLDPRSNQAFVGLALS